MRFPSRDVAGSAARYVLMNPRDYLDALITLPQLSRCAVSPDGLRLAWTWFGIGPAADVYAAPTDGSAPPVPLTEGADNSLLVSWTPDSRAVVVRRDHAGDERAQLFRIDLDRPGDLQPLTAASPPYFLRGGQIHPNGRWLIYAMNFDLETDREIEPTWVYRHDLRTGERVPLARPTKAAYYRPELNETGTHILYSRQDIDPAGSQVWLVDVEGREDREILNVGPRAKVEASWFPDGERVLFLAETDTHRRLGVWRLGGGSIRWLLDDPGRNVEQAFVPRGAGARAVLVESRDARDRASLLDLDGGLENPLPEAAGDLIPLRPLGSGEWIGQYTSATQPADLVRFRPQDVRPDSFTSLTGVWDHTALRPENLVPAEDFRWRSVDGLEIQGWLYRARGRARGTIVCVHGGPTWHSRNEFDPEIQFLAAQGFHVLDPNYRGSTGFGLSFQDAVKTDGWGGREQDDIRTGIEALLAAGIARPGKVGMTGTSYGGYSTWCAVTRWPRDIIAAGAPICGMTDLVVDYETTRPDLRPYSEEMMGGRPDQVPERFYERSPIHFVDRIQARLLIVQGLRDPNVTPENVRTVRDALDRAGIAYHVLTFDNEGHGIARPDNQRTLYRRLAGFFTEAFL